MRLNRTPVVLRNPFSERGVLLCEHRRDLSTSFYFCPGMPQWGWNRAAAFPHSALLPDWRASPSTLAAGDLLETALTLRPIPVRLERRVLGRPANDQGKRLRMICVLEMSAGHRLHYHCIFERPCHCSFDRFRAVIRDQWLKTDFRYQQIDIQDHSEWTG